MRIGNLIPSHLHLLAILLLPPCGLHAETWHQQYDGPRTERQDVFAFTAKPKVRFLGNDKYEISFAIKGYCDVAASLIDKRTKRTTVPMTVVSCRLFT